MAAPLSQAKDFASLNYFLSCDPPGRKLGSGGGTAHLLVSAMEARQSKVLHEWLTASRKLIIHGGGSSRRLPAYAALGKPLIPIPLLQNTTGQHFDQTLIDMQAPLYESLLSRAPESLRVMVASGDVLLRFGSHVPAVPEADVVLLGMQVPASIAQQFGVFFLSRHDTQNLAFMLQKPNADRIRRKLEDHSFLVDTGMWMLSERAVEMLLAKCGWNAAENRFTGGSPEPYELYAQFGLALGTQPTHEDEGVSSLSCAVMALPNPEFYHLGTSRQLIDSVSLLKRRSSDPIHIGMTGVHADARQHIHNASVETHLSGARSHTLWIENAFIPASWRLTHDHVLTGVPENSWNMCLEPGACLDCAPIDEALWCFRGYGIDDPFQGAIRHPATRWFGAPALEWFARRGIDPEHAGVSPDVDIHEAPLFPVMLLEEMSDGLLNWMLATHPGEEKEYTEQWLNAPRLSAREIAERIQVGRVLEQRRIHQERECAAMYRDTPRRMLALDIEASAPMLARDPDCLNEPIGNGRITLDHVHDRMLRAAVFRHRGSEDWQTQEKEAFRALQELVLADAHLTPSLPVYSIVEDQIVWGRSPVRLDLAGGWTDTPPYCLEHGGKVVNLAVNLNGQPPIQVFVRRCPRRELVIRSIDQGVGEPIRTYEQLESYAQVGSAFSLAKAALAMCGFLPAFHQEGGYASLEHQLDAMGGGLEISLLAAIPAGSGLGTSSIMAATLLGTLSESCGLNWDKHVLMARTLGVEQMLTTGGGWQDQAGGLFHGVKLLETAPGLAQRPSVRWLPPDLFEGRSAQEVNLLYYTGITRTAKHILQDIVRGMFLNSRPVLSVLKDIGDQALVTFEAVQRADRRALCRAVAGSWSLNRRLDAGTNPPEIEAILAQTADYLAGAKLLGAGGGGYLLMLAKDVEAAARIRASLKQAPPNPRARFVEFSLSSTGLEITRS